MLKKRVFEINPNNTKTNPVTEIKNPLLRTKPKKTNPIPINIPNIALNKIALYPMNFNFPFILDIREYIQIPNLLLVSNL